jgi:transcriptional regulator with XRE-family HTH domain
MTVGFKIKKLREELNLPQMQLANELQVSQSELSKIENGQVKKIDFLLMVKVLNFFGKDISFFVDENLKMNAQRKNSKEKESKQEKLKTFHENIMKEIQLFIGEEQIA